MDKLIKKGYADRIVCVSNRRKVEITITQEGLEVLSEMDIAMKKSEKDLLANLTDLELEQLNQLFNKF